MPLPGPASRRQFLLALSGCVAAIASPVSARTLAVADVANLPASQIQAFMSVCNALAGTAVSNEALARQYLTVLVEHLDGAQITTLLALAQLPAGAIGAASLRQPLREVVEFALQLWMSGMTGNDRVLAYTEAAVWSTLPFTKPPGVCGGAFGYWAEAPV